MSDEMVIEWPFGDDFVTTDYLESRGWYIV